MSAQDDLRVVRSLDELAELVERHRGLYVRWSRGPETDLREVSSTDDLTGVPLPGLSASPLGVEAWWEDRPVRVWVARRLHDYVHLLHDKGPGVHPWVLTGKETARGPDNEPLVTDVRPMCRLDQQVIEEAKAEVARQENPWGPLRRR
ncbi:DUF6098 family protein [Streptomyces sp. NPDC013187]|uniref:DUF6098 family protein n=1 Tax=Streptomyces sp. NPDC013187 TaxID=3364865 RepID=UPI003697D8A1